MTVKGRPKKVPSYFHERHGLQGISRVRQPALPVELQDLSVNT